MAAHPAYLPRIPDPYEGLQEKGNTTRLIPPHLLQHLLEEHPRVLFEATTTL